jgi:hypothetical protein
MKLKMNRKTPVFAGLMVLVLILPACKDMFKDPTKDKNTGESITLLLMDRNFITTKLAVHLQDAQTQQPIDDQQITIQFSGDDASNLITFGGKKQTSFSTSTGFVEVGYDPNISVDAANPIELSVFAGNDNYVSAPVFLSFTSTGIKDVIISLYRNSSLKSASVSAFDEPFDLKFNGQLQSSGLHFISGISGSPTGTAWEYLNLYTATTAGTLTCDNLKDNLLYADYGAYVLRPGGGLAIMPPTVPTKNVNIQSGDYVYSAVLRSSVSKCDQPLTIHVERPNNETGTGVFKYRLTFADGKTSEGKISCTFPSNNTIEQVYYPTSNPAVKVELFGDLQYDLSAPVNLSSPCGATASFTAIPKAGLKTYKLVTRYSCPESAMGMGLSIIGEFRKKGSTDVWTSFKFIEGVCVLQLAAGNDYDFRFNVDSEYYYYTLPTDPTKVASYLLNSQSEDFKFRNLSIDSTNSQVTITTDVQFSAAVCDVIR